MNLVLNDTQYKYRIKVKFQEGRWFYQRACYMQLKLPEGILLLIDENSNGRYNDYDIDRIVLPDSAWMVKPKKEIYLGKGKKIWKYQLVNLDETGLTINLTKTIINGDPVCLEGLVYFNQFRIRMGLSPVGFSEDLSRGCELHAKYLVLNKTSGHGENPNNPGYSREGREAGKNSVISYRHPNYINSIDGWLATFFHRIPLIHPGLQNVGLAFYERIGLLDSRSDCDLKCRHEPIVYPYEDQKDVPLKMASERPTPLPRNAKRSVGYPITLTFFPLDWWNNLRIPPIKNVVASLKDDKNKSVEFYLSSPEKPAHEVMRHNCGSICLIPKVPLKPKTKYTVHIKCSFKGKDVTKQWSFTTR